MKALRVLSISLMFLLLAFSCTALAQDASATRPRQVADEDQQKQSDESASRLANNGTVSAPEPDFKVAASWVALKAVASHSGSKTTAWRPSRLRNPVQDQTPPPTIDETHEGFTVSGKAKDGVELTLYVNDAARTEKAKSRGGVYTFRLTKDPLKCKDKIQVSYTESGNEISSEPTSVICGIDLTRGNLIGLAPFGVVMSQQAEKFSQADPFGGFVIGYMGPQRKRMMPDGNGGVRPLGPNDDLSKAILVPKGNLNVRIQGIFQSAARTASAPAEMMMTPAASRRRILQAAQDSEETTFIASRKSFDVEMHLWYEWPLSHIVWAGPYVAIGGSSVLDRNELQGEAVKKDNATLDTDQAKTSNDIDKYYEGGFLLDLYSGDPNDANLYIQAILAYGNYEALADLRPQSNTKHRFVGKLRVFPTGLNRNFFEHGVAAPMFGVELNAGRGEDQLKFFVGVAFNVSKLISNLKGKPPTP